MCFIHFTNQHTLKTYNVLGFFFLGIKYLEANKTDTTLRFYSAFSIWSLDDGGSGTRVVNRKQISNCIKYVFHDD